MDSYMPREFTRFWSHLPHVQPGMHGFVAHLHDAGLSALAGAIILLGVVILLELRSVGRLRHVTDRSLERVFEQLDLLRFETQALLEERREAREAAGRRGAAIEYAAPTRPQTAAVGASGRSTVPPPAAAAPAVAAARAPAAVPAAPGLPRASVLPATRMAEAAAVAAGRELAERRNLSSGEARLLSSLAEARARRTGLAEAARA